MSTESIVLKKLQYELANVEVGKMSLEIKIAERQEDIRRLLEQVQISDNKIAELKRKIDDQLKRQT